MSEQPSRRRRIDDAETVEAYVLDFFRKPVRDDLNANLNDTFFGHLMPVASADIGPKTSYPVGVQNKMDWRQYLLNYYQMDYSYNYTSSWTTYDWYFDVGEYRTDHQVTVSGSGTALFLVNGEFGITLPPEKIHKVEVINWVMPSPMFKLVRNVGDKFLIEGDVGTYSWTISDHPDPNVNGSYSEPSFVRLNVGLFGEFPVVFDPASNLYYPGLSIDLFSEHGPNVASSGGFDPAVGTCNISSFPSIPLYPSKTETSDGDEITTTCNLTATIV